MTSAVLAPVRSSIVLIATVEPCRNRLACENAVPALVTPALDALHHGTRRRQALAEQEPARSCIEGSNVGEGAADVGGETQSVR